MYTTKAIWLLWFQGWETAPDVAKASLNSWQQNNPGWTVHALDKRSLRQFLPHAEFVRIMDSSTHAEALSDLVRFELLHRYGGVWADATTICAKPLDNWLPPALQTGFFAFHRPGRDRLLSTWFLAAHQGSRIIQAWREAAAVYWKNREERDDYFWPHKLFEQIYASDRHIQRLWDQAPKLPARHDFHFGPDNPVLKAPPPEDLEQILATTSIPVFKLTHKFEAGYAEASLMSSLCKYGLGIQASPETKIARQRKVLVAWYGSFAGHGTIGDQFALESVVNRLVAAGHDVSHATAAELDLPGATRADWEKSDPEALDAVVFVCGPILKTHKQTSVFFDKFSGSRLAGISVSLMPEDDPNFINPFEVVFARQCHHRKHGDVAVISPQSAHPKTGDTAPGYTIGLVLRGKQGEYGTDRCLWQETEAAANAVVDHIRTLADVRVIHIENKLSAAQKSASEIEDQYTECDLIITSRFHGAIAALRNGVPFIAIDQIRDGGKVYELISDLGWPFTYEISKTDKSLFPKVGEYLLKQGCTSADISCDLAIQAANVSLSALEAWLLSDLAS